VLYLQAYDGTDQELWRYDGTTLSEVDINPLGAALAPESITFGGFS
jgi:ELWxxDGT repeat protein